ncbi:MAG: thiamine phosphate synthase [Clostridiales bacterium]|nr:thiamine phosphate synthase [Clostridiales bacterium]
MKPKIDYTLYLVTDRNLMFSPTIEDLVEQAIKGGCTLIQLREKDSSSLEFYEMALRVREVTNQLDIPLIINDRVDIAIAVNADGVHIGQNDLPIDAVRNIIGYDKIIGVSASNLSEALNAQRGGADYLGIGAMFATDTKSDANLTSFDELQKIREAISLPLVVIGGINRTTAPLFHGSGVDGLAVVSAIAAREDVCGAARELKQLFLKGR